MFRYVAVFGLSLAALTAEAAEPVYKDDRSTPVAVVQSLYNAINRQEYLRGWSYFSDGAAPAYSDFKSGYSDTDTIELRLGQGQSEGAAGSVITTIPVVIRAHHSDGSSAVFAGCYTFTQVNPELQDAPPFQPITISKAHLATSKQGFKAASPGCE